MAEIIKKINVDVSKKNTFQAIVAKQGDTNSRFLQVQLVSEGESINIDLSSSVLINALRSDDRSDSFLGSVNPDGTVKVPLTPWMLEIDGLMTCSISVIDSQGRRLTSTSFAIEVQFAENTSGEINEDENYDILISLLADVSSTKEDTIKATNNANSAATNANTAAASANQAVEDYNSSKEAIDQSVANVNTLNLTASADANKATQAKVAAESAAARAEASEDNMNGKVEQIENKIALKGDNLFFNEDDGKLYLMSDGEIIGDGVTVATSGGGSGGSSNNAVLSIQNTTGWLSKSIAENSDCILTGTWSSLEDGISTGDGVLNIKIGGITKYSTNVKQGDFKINVAPYLSTGSNTVKVNIVDVYGNNRTINYSINVIVLSLTSTFNADSAYEGDITYVYIPKGSVVKTMHFILDGNEIGTSEVSVSGRQQSFTISSQTHGSHTFEVYFNATIDGELIESNHLYYDLICVENGNTTPIIVSNFKQSSANQYETLSIPYIVYDPKNLTSTAILKANGVIISTLSVDRTKQIWAYRCDTTGEISLTISCGNVTKTLTTNVIATTINVSAVSEDLELNLSAYGRSNNESNPSNWLFNNIQCSFAGYNWSSDGWVIDEKGNTIHRVSGDARLTIPLKVFANDFRTTGKTIELEFATRNVLNYDSIIVSCYSGNKGFKLTSQEAILKSEQSEIKTQYKENEHIRLSIVVEKKSENRLIYIYLNGIMCGSVQYPSDDDFSQTSPVDITIGSNDCTIDIYNIRVYNNNLTRHQILDNWIADTQDINDKLERYNRNNVYDAYGSIVVDKLPNTIPYLVIVSSTLPTYKGNKVTISGYYVDPINSNKSFTFENAEADVQGTSSAGYAVKNLKIKFKNGFEINGVHSEGYQLRSNSIATNTFTFKADVASSEGANNVELVKLYNDVSPYKTPPQELNSSIRQGIDGLPIVIFHNNGTDTIFVGKYNFNNDKGTPEVYGFEEDDESWEIKNNTSNRVLFKSADFSNNDWKADFEARYPEDNTNVSKLSAFVSWVASTDQSTATNLSLGSSISYNGKIYTQDTAEYRLAKFKAEFENYAELDSALFYYLFTELFLMVDSRAKNAFPSIIGGDKICWLPYDMDTALGINNEGALVFGYELEDTDQTSSGADIYNGQQSVLWTNIRQAFTEELKEMYQKLRSDNKLSYSIIEKAFEEHQSTWAEAIWNEDAYYKYLQPLIENGTGVYLSMLQGSKSEQRKWWLYNRFRYIDSKYNAGDSLSDFITLRGYFKGNITIEPYADIYASIKYGSYLVQQRALRGNTYTLNCPLDNLNDTEIYIYSSSQLKDIGDLSPLKVGLADFSMATKLQSLKLGDNSSSYSNGNLTSLTLGNNTLLNTLDVRNCINLGTGEQQSIDLSGCTNIEKVYFDGTSIKGVTLPNGGILKVLHLPETITNLTIRNQTAIEEFTLPKYSNITTLRLENVNDIIDELSILKSIAANSRVRLIGINWSFNSYTEVSNILDILDTMRGLDENNDNTDKAQISGTIHINTLTGTELENLQNRYSSINFTYDRISFYVNYYDSDNTTLLYVDTVAQGANAIDPVANSLITAPSKADTDDTKYNYNGWSNLPTNIQSNQSVIVSYKETYRVRFYNGNSLLSTQWVDKGSNASYSGSTPTKSQTAQYTYTFSGWGTSSSGSVSSSILNNIKTPKDVYAIFTASTRKYTVYFYNGDTLLSSVSNVAYGSSATYSGTTPTSSNAEEEFSGWNPQPTNIKGDTYCYAVFTNPNALDGKTWAEISEISELGNAANYFSVGDCKAITLNGTVGTIDFDNQELYVYILGFNHNSEYEGNGISFGTFKTAKSNGIDVCLVDEKYASYISNGTKYFNMNHWGNYNYGGWSACDMRYDILGSTDVQPSTYGSSPSSGRVGYNPTESCATSPVENTLMAALPSDLRAVMKPITKYSNNTGGSGDTAEKVTTTIDYLPLLSEFEIFGSRSYANSAEQNYQVQYDYYSAGNSKKKYKHNSTGSSANWWERSAYYSSSNYFCYVGNDGNANFNGANYSIGVAPAFKI